MMATAQQIQNWSTGIGLPLCIGQEFADEHGGALPGSNTELCQWASSTGRRTPNGVWQCTTSTGAASEPVSGSWKWLAIIFGGMLLFKKIGRVRL